MIALKRQATLSLSLAAKLPLAYARQGGFATPSRGECISSMEQNILFHHTPATATILLTCWVEMAQEMPLTISETLFVVGDGVFVTRLDYEKKGLIW